VDYLGLADQLKQALATYTESGGRRNPTFDTAQAIAVLQEKYEVACDMLHGFDWSAWTTLPAALGQGRLNSLKEGDVIPDQSLRRSPHTARTLGKFPRRLE